MLVSPHRVLCATWLQLHEELCILLHHCVLSLCAFCHHFTPWKSHFGMTLLRQDGWRQQTSIGMCCGRCLQMLLARRGWRWGGVEQQPSAVTVDRQTTLWSPSHLESATRINRHTDTGSRPSLLTHTHTPQVFTMMVNMTICYKTRSKIHKSMFWCLNNPELHRGYSLFISSVTFLTTD